MTKHPWTAVPATRSSAPVLKIKLYALAGAIGLMCALSLISFLGFIGSRGAGVATATDDAVLSDERAFAEQVARDMLSGRPTTLAVAAGVDSSFGFSNSDAGVAPAAIGFRDLVWSGTRSNVVNERAYRIHSFSVRTGDQTLVLDVTTMRSSEGFPVLVAQPSLAPAVVPKVIPPLLDFAEDANVIDSTPTLVRDVVALWAAAYATNNAGELHRLANDPNANGYVGLGGFGVVGEPSYGVAVQAVNAPTMNVRVRVVFRSTGANQYQVSNDFDLLIGDWETALPKVVAWGPPGSAIALTPYSNNTSSGGTTAPAS